MRLWRLARVPHSALDGDGARVFGGRWNSPGQPMVYCAGSAALAVLEVRVHLDVPLELLPEDYRLFGIEIGNVACEDAPLTALESPRSHGDSWLAARHTALLRVPSLIVPEERNVLINPLHPDAQRIQIVSQRAFTFDPRLF
ncbi:MAG: hypothetical protein A2516_06870 [Alphaproteobacteria bacterium RIFOXYD12_FULL_60_8]|nr:MAG: hypothetical protein A2516_06870 [Alphaproteobacteria bacterium RIFOXYD12_FULL_60_8]